LAGVSNAHQYRSGRRAGGRDVRTKRELVDLALREFVAARRRRDVSELFGKVEIDPDYDYKARRREDA